MACSREEEIEVIRSIYCDAVDIFETVDDTHFIFRSHPVVLFLTLPLSYPDSTSQSLEIMLDSEGLGISRLQLFELQMRLDTIIQSKPDEPVLFELFEETREFTQGLRQDIETYLEEEEEEIDEDIYADMDDLERRKRYSYLAKNLLTTATGITDQEIVQSHMGSTTIDDIMSRLPSTIKLLHAEIVLRKDLRSNFMDLRRKIQLKATHHISDRRKKDAAWDELGKQEIVFHGTPRHNVGSIVKSGFVVPGKKTANGETVNVRCGSTWGRGIYTSPDPSFSLSYTDYTEGGVKGRKRLLPGQKLIVSAVVMGRRCHLKESRRRNPNPEEGYDSHVSPSKYEYIVFDSAQVLPLYVFHLGEGRHTTSFQDTSLRSDSITFALSAGDLTAQARKHLPNGYGAASGHRFEVLAIAPVDDDEELWGEYQHDESDEKGEFQDERWDYWNNYFRNQ